MTDETRTLMFRVIDDVKTDQMLHVMHLICNLTRRDDVLRWLLRAEMKGFSLLNWLRTEWQGSAMELARFVLGKLDREKNKKIIFGVDWQP